MQIKQRVGSTSTAQVEYLRGSRPGCDALADTLALASARKPKPLLDYASLTGSTFAALGTTYSGVLANCDRRLPMPVAAGRSSGAPAWPFPCGEDLAPLVSDATEVTGFGVRYGLSVLDHHLMEPA
jgi:leucyl aminopeptidase